VCAVDARHPARADQLLELVPARDHLPGHLRTEATRGPAG
jgi:hypothetical protein